MFIGFGILSACLMAVPGFVSAAFDKVTQGDCSPIITGDIKATEKIECKASKFSAAALVKFEADLQENYRNQKNLNDLIDKLKGEISHWEEKYKDASTQNADDLKKRPDDSLLEVEQRALQTGEIEQAAEIREEYYVMLKDVFLK